MLGKTHFVLGMASALIIAHPQTVPGVITTMTAGAIGGWIVDVDIKNRDISRSDDAARENVYDFIIDTLFILAFIALDFFIGKGMCQYVVDNWGVMILGALIGLVILLFIGLRTKHRTFTHSFLAMALFTVDVFLFCRPAAIPFAIGYASHLVADFFNKLGLQLFFPLKWRPCLKLCRSDKKANRVLFWVSLAIDVALGAFLFAKAMNGVDQGTSRFIHLLTTKKLFRLNFLQLYLIFINALTFLGFQRSQMEYRRDWSDAYYRGVEYNDADYETAETRFFTWILNFLVFIGGGIGMMLSLVINHERPVAYNGVWWSFCYTSILFWSTVYLYLCNPFGFAISRVQWLNIKHIPAMIYLIGVNAVSSLFLFFIRKRRFKETDVKHTIIFMLGALGGTIGAIPMVFFINREGKYYYIIVGFSIMLISQIVFIMYLLAAGII